MHNFEQDHIKHYILLIYMGLFCYELNEPAEYMYVCADTSTNSHHIIFSYYHTLQLNAVLTYLYSYVVAVRTYCHGNNLMII